MDHLEWDFSAPTPSPLGDHDVPQEGSHLRDRHIALMVCGGIAALKTPLLARALRRQGAQVVAFASTEALRFVAQEALEWSCIHPVITQLSYRAEHLSDDQPFDAYLVAPATYNTINKVAAGIADGVITSSLASALGRLELGQTQVLMAPTMHGSLHHRLLVASCRRLADLGVRLIAPRDAYGKHNLPDESTLVAAVCRSLSQSVLRGRSLGIASQSPALEHVVCGPARAFPAAVARRIAEEATLRGADAWLLHGLGVEIEAGWLQSVPLPGQQEVWLEAAQMAAARAWPCLGRAGEQVCVIAPGSHALDASSSRPAAVPRMLSQLRWADPDLPMKLCDVLEREYSSG